MILDKKSRVQARFLLGPAGSGKTFRCLTEIRAALQAAAEGLPLILLAPKQATFQLERQLLIHPAADALNGYTRLHIFSFERLAQFVLARRQVAPPRLLAEEGRVMVLRALLLRHENELRRFRRSARRPGFAWQLSQLLGELHQHHFTPTRLRALASRLTGQRELPDKLHDLALLDDACCRWLVEHELQDTNRLLDIATDVLRETGVAASRPSAATPSKIRRSADRRYDSTTVARRFRGDDAAGVGLARGHPAVLRTRDAGVLSRKHASGGCLLAFHLVVRRQDLPAMPPTA